MKTYKDDNGMTLEVFQESSSGLYFVGWWNPTDELYEPVVGEVPLDQRPDPPQNKCEWESWTAERAVQPLADEELRGGFGFYTKKKAWAALTAAIIALSNKEQPWPDWAVKAKMEGWRPPKGWKP